MKERTFRFSVFRKKIARGMRDCVFGTRKEKKPHTSKNDSIDPSVFDEAIQFLKQKTHLRQDSGVAKLSLRQGYGIARQDSGLPRMITSSQRRALQGSRQKGTDPLILASPSPLPPSLRGVFDEAIQSSRSRATGPVTSFTNDGDQKEQKTHLRQDSGVAKLSLRQGYGIAKLSLRQGYGVAKQDSGLPRMITSSQRRALQGSRRKGTDPLILASPSPLPPSLRGVFDEAIQSSRSRATGPVTSFTNDGDQKEQKTHLRQDSGVAKLSLRQGYGIAKLSLRQGYGVAKQDSGLPRMITSSQRRALQGSRRKERTDCIVRIFKSLRFWKWDFKIFFKSILWCVRHPKQTREALLSKSNARSRHREDFGTRKSAAIQNLAMSWIATREYALAPARNASRNDAGGKTKTFFRALSIRNIQKLFGNWKFKIQNFILYFLKHPVLAIKLCFRKLKQFTKWSFATLPRRVVSSVLIILMVLLPIADIFFAPKASAAWWNDSWLYRKAITVTNNTTAQTNVYIALTLDTSDTTKFQATCGDLRFTDATGNLQDYFIVSGCGTASTSVHVNLKTFPAGVQTIFAYYGNPTAPNGASSSDFATQASSYTIGSIASEEKSPGPVAAWKFDEGAGIYAQDSVKGGIGSATGGTITTVNGYKIHTFTSSGTFTPATNGNVEVLVVAGGGGGGSDVGGGGGAGGLIYNPSYQVSAGVITVTIGSGGAGAIVTPFTVSGQGANSVFSGLTAIGGGGGGSWNGGSGVAGGSGGGATSNVTGGGGAGTAGQGMAGGAAAGNTGNINNYSGASGGGGAGQVGGSGISAGWSANSSTYGYGGKGLQYSISGTPTYYAGGGGSSSDSGMYFGLGGLGGGGNGNGVSAVANTGGGGGGGGGGTGNGGSGGSGIVIVRYPITNDGTLTNMASPATPTSGWQNEEMCVAGKCLAFDGTDDSVNQPTSIPNVQSLSFWVRPATTTQSILQLSSSVSVSASSGTIVATGFASPTIYVNGKVNSTITANTWSHIEITSNTAFTADAIKFGVIGSTYFNGKIDEPKLFPYARTKAQVQQDYNAGAANAGANSGTAASFGDSSDKWLSDGLVGYWKMDENSWNGTAGEVKDASGNGNNGVSVNGATTNAGKFGGAGIFDGVSKYVNEPTSINGAQTVSFWVNPASNTQSFLQLASGVSVSASSGTVSAVGFTSPKIYVNGTLNGTITASTWNLITITTTTGVTANALKFGVAGSTYFSGSLDETRIYNRALSPAEIRKLYSYDSFSCGTSTIRDGVNNLTYGTVLAKDGHCWLDRNLGATQVATSSTDTNSYGWYYQWGRGTDGHQLSTSSTSTTLSPTDSVAAPDTTKFITTSVIPIDWRSPQNNNLWQGVSGTNNPCPSGWRVPAQNEWNALLSSEGVSNITGAFVSTLKIPLAGYRAYTGTIANNNSGYYWSSSISGADSTAMVAAGPRSDSRAYGYPVRCIKDDLIKEPVAYYKFDEGNGTTANNSGTGDSALNGTLTNMAAPATATSGWTDAGKFGKGLNFDGVDDYVNLTPAGGITRNKTKVTSAYWIKMTALPSSGQTYYPFLETNNNIGYTKFGIYINSSGSVGIIWRDTASGSSFTVESATNAVVAGSWQHIVSVLDTDNDVQYLYVNGQLVKSGAVVSAGIFDDAPAYAAISGKPTGWSTTSSVSGSIDEVKVYSYALSPDDIKIEYDHGASAAMASSGPIVAGGGSSTSARAEYCPPGNVEGNCASGQNPSPVAEWQLDEGTGTTAKDTSGNNNTGTLTNGPTWTNGKFGNAVKFDGSSNYISAASFSNATSVTDYSYGFWFYLNSFSHSRMYAFDFRGNGSAASGTAPLFIIDQSGGSCLLNAYTGYELISGAVPCLAQWHYISVTRAGSVTSIYMDGILQKTGNSGTGSSDLSAGKRIGTYSAASAGGNYWWNGKLDGFKFYNYARTPAQIAWDYNRGGPVGWWKMDECQGATIHDSSGNANDGTLTVGASGTQTSAGTCTTASTAWGNGATGKFNSSLNFDGTDDYVKYAGNNTGLSGNFSGTLSAWIYPTNINSSMQTVVGLLANSNTAGADAAILLNLNGAGSVGFHGGFCGQNTAAGVISNNNWYHLVVVKTPGPISSTTKIYINGKETATTNQYGDCTPALNVSKIELGSGWWNSDNGTPFSGRIDDVRIYNYALTKEQIFNVMNRGASLKFGN